MPLSLVRNDNTSSLDVRRLKVPEQAMLVASGRRNSIVPNERLREDEDLPTVAGIGH
jgi:hypothetical protein